MDNHVLWLAILVVMLIIEIITIGNLVSIWFAIGALVAFGVSFLTGSVVIQGTVFFAVSIAALLLIRPLTRKAMRGNEISTNVDSLIGRKFKLSSDILENTWGSIKIDGSLWTAIAADHQEILSGATVEVIAIDGVKVVVRELQG